jgi:hypothetical protein
MLHLCLSSLPVICTLSTAGVQAMHPNYPARQEERSFVDHEHDPE